MPFVGWPRPMTPAQASKLDRWSSALLVLLAFVLPISLKVFASSPGLEIIFPAEVIIALIAMLAAATVTTTYGRSMYDREFLTHPISCTVGAYLLATGIATAFSTMPLISLKAWTVECAYVAVFFLFMGARHATSGSLAPVLFRGYSIAFMFVAMYAFSRQIEGRFDRASAGFVPFPFYSDHTIFSAALVFVLTGTLFATIASWRSGELKSGRMLLLAFLSLVLLVLLYLTFCRAAWLSVMTAVTISLVLPVRSRLPVVLLALAIAVCVLPLLTGHRFGTTVDSNAHRTRGWGSLMSLTNSTTDPSNVERLNRWKCAVRMFLERPLTGFGPGTYQFKYVPFQQPGDLTALSIVTDTVPPELITKALSIAPGMFVRKNPQVHQYHGGTAHSEYLLVLSESGILSFAPFMTLALLSVVYGIRVSRSANLRGTSTWIGYAAAIALLAYHVHALFNNYLDDCKIAFLYWGALAALVRSDVSLRGPSHSLAGASVK